MGVTTDLLLITAAVCLIVSLALAWLASFIVYARVALLKRIFPATHQLIRAHIDYLLMSLLLVMSVYLIEKLLLDIPVAIMLLVCLGALYNPFGFIVLAVKPKLANPETRGEVIRILVGFLPASIGYGYIMFAVLASLL